MARLFYFLGCAIIAATRLSFHFKRNAQTSFTFNLNFAAKLFREPNSLAYIIVYPQYYVQTVETGNRFGKTRVSRKIESDSPQTTRQIMRAVKNELAKKYNFPANRIRVVNGGYRNFRSVETWILPRGEHPPVATPNAFPKFRQK